MRFRDTEKKSRGLTLIEMTMAVAIIGILASVVVMNTGPARKQAALRGAKSAMETARGTAVLCMFRESNLSTPQSGVLMCSATDISWPDLSKVAPGWSYTASFDGDMSDRRFNFGATSGAGASDVTINCSGTATTSACL